MTASGIRWGSQP